MRKVIFIDFKNTIDTRGKFDKNKSKLLLDLVKETDSELVVFGYWKDNDFNKLYNSLKDRGLDEELINKISASVFYKSDDLFKEKKLYYPTCDGSDIDFWIYRNLQRPYIENPSLVSAYQNIVNGLNLGYRTLKRHVDYQYVIISSLSNQSFLLSQVRDIVFANEEGLTKELTEKVKSLLNDKPEEKKESKYNYTNWLNEPYQYDFE